MGNLFTPLHVIVILVLVLLLFGRGKISEIMGEFAKGINSFKKGLKDHEHEKESGTTHHNQPHAKSKSTRSKKATAAVAHVPFDDAGVGVVGEPNTAADTVLAETIMFEPTTSSASKKPKARSATSKKASAAVATKTVKKTVRKPKI